MPENAQFVPKMMPNGQGPPTVVVQGSGDPISAIPISNNLESAIMGLESCKQFQMVENIKIS